MKEKTLEEILKNTNENNCDQVDWTKAWAQKYPVLGTYQKEVNVAEYAGKVRVLLDQLKKEHGYSEVDAMLVLKDILAHEMKR